MLFFILVISCSDDRDQDGFEIEVDCNDKSSVTYPGAAEICDGIDNDCDGEIDEFVGIAYFYDEDQDGFGDPESPQYSCDGIPEGYVEASGDCDDSNPSIHPQAEEICDGHDSDCDPDTVVDVGVYFFDGNENIEYTQDFAWGTRENPVEFNVNLPGELRFCGGEWYTNLNVSSDVTLIGEGGFENNVLNGGEQHSVVFVNEGQVEIQGLSLVNGSGMEDSTGKTYGGGVCCYNSKISMKESRIGFNSAYLGGGMYVEGCEVQVRDSIVEYNQSRKEGGGIYFLSGALDAEQLHLKNNSSPIGGGWACTTNSCSLSIRDSEIKDNFATQGGGAAFLALGELQIRDTEIRNNRSSGQGGAFYVLPFLDDIQISMSDVVLEDNDAPFGGGVAIFLSEYDYNISLESQWGTSSLRRNHSQQGGAISIWDDQENPSDGSGFLELVDVNTGSEITEDDNSLSDIWFGSGTQDDSLDQFDTISEYSFDQPATTACINNSCE